MKTMVPLLLVWVEASQNGLDITFKLDYAGDWVTDQITVGTPAQPLLLKLADKTLCLKTIPDEPDATWGLSYNPHVSTTSVENTERFGFGNQRFLTLPYTSSNFLDNPETYSGRIDITNIEPLNDEYSTISISSLGSVMHVEFQGTPENGHPMDHRLVWFVPKAVWSWMGKTLPTTTTLLNLGRHGIVLPPFMLDDLYLDDPERFSWYSEPHLGSKSVRRLLIRENADYSQFAPLLITLNEEIFVIPWTEVGCRKRESDWCETKISVWTAEQLYIEIGNMLLDSFDRLILDTRSRLVTLEGPISVQSAMMPRLPYIRMTTFHPPVVFVDIYGRSWLRLYHSSVSLPVGLPLALPELAGSPVFESGTDPMVLFYNGAPERAVANIVVRGACTKEARWTNPRSLHERILGFTIYKELQLDAITITGVACTVTISKQHGRIEINLVDNTLSPTLREEPEEVCSICIEAMTTGSEEIRLKCGHTFHVSCVREWLRDHNSCPFCRVPPMPVPILRNSHVMRAVTILKTIPFALAYGWALLLSAIHPSRALGFAFLEFARTFNIFDDAAIRCVTCAVVITSSAIVGAIFATLQFRVYQVIWPLLRFYNRMFFHFHGYPARVARAIQKHNEKLLQ